MTTENARPVKCKVWWNPKPPAFDNDNWEFIVSIIFSNREEKKCQWFLPNPDLQGIAAVTIGRHLRHDGTDTTQAQDLNDNWAALQPTLNERASSWFRENPSQLASCTP